MIEFGKTLRQAREAKGYTVAQVAELTKMAPSTVMELEEENFSRIAAPIYGRGFVKLYCETVGIDAKPLVDEFMSIYRGERSVGIRERKVAEPAAPAPEPPPVPAPPPAPEPPLVPEPPPRQEPPPAPSEFPDELDLPPSDGGEPPPSSDPFAFQEASEPAQSQGHEQRTLSRYAAPVRTIHAPSVPPAVWRMAILGTLALLVLWGVAVGVRALYRATTSDSPTTEEPTTPPPEPPMPPSKPVAKPAPVAKPVAKPAPAPAPVAKPAPAPAPVAKPTPAAKPAQAAKAKPAAAAKPAPAAKPKQAPAKAKPASTSKHQPAKAGRATSRKVQKIPSLYVDS